MSAPYTSPAFDHLAPSAALLQEMGEASLAELPPSIREACGNLDIRVEEFAEEAVLDALDIENPFDLMGLYHGAPLTQKSHLDPTSEPDRVFLYRRPILDYWAEHEETLQHIVRHILIHEIGHHFGFSDERMEAIEREVPPSSSKDTLTL